MAWVSDEEYTFIQDIKEKKAAGRGAFHRKCGAKSRKCTLPHERLTKKELEKMNGEVMTYNPNSWYSWQEFQKLPSEYQTKYINSLMTRYNCSFAAVAEVVFNRKSSNLHAFLKRRNSLQYINMPDPAIGKKLLPGKEKLKEAMERALWPNHDEEIQNGSEETVDAEEPKDFTIQEKIKQAQDTVNLYESRGMPITPELINQIYEEKTGMSFAMVKEFNGKDLKEMAFTSNGSNVSSEVPNIYSGDPIGKVEHVLETEHGLGFTVTLNDGITPEDILNPHPVELKDSTNSTDVKSFSIVMDHIDMSLIQYVSGLFNGKKISVSIEVKQIE